MTSQPKYHVFYRQKQNILLPLVRYYCGQNSVLNVVHVCQVGNLLGQPPIAAACVGTGPASAVRGSLGLLVLFPR